MALPETHVTKTQQTGIQAALEENAVLRAELSALRLENIELRAFLTAAGLQFRGSKQCKHEITKDLDASRVAGHHLPWCIEIFSFLPILDLLRFGATSQAVMVTIERSNFWHEACHCDLGLGSTPFTPAELAKLPVGNWRCLYLQAVCLRPQWEGVPGESRRTAWNYVPRLAPTSLKVPGPDYVFVEAFTANDDRSVVSTRKGWASVAFDAVDFSDFPQSVAIPLSLALPNVSNMGPYVEVRVVAQMDGMLFPLIDSSSAFADGEANYRSLFFSGGLCTKLFCCPTCGHERISNESCLLFLDIRCDMDIEVNEAETDCMLHDLTLSFNCDVDDDDDSEPLLTRRCSAGFWESLLPSGVEGFRELFRSPRHAYALQPGEFYSNSRYLCRALEDLRSARETWCSRCAKCRSSQLQMPGTPT